MDAKQILASLDEYFYDIPTECPYGLPHIAVYHQAYFSSMPQDLLELFLAAGFRRNGNTIYCMRCRGCAACVPIRLETDAHRRTRNMQRVWRRNQDLEIQIGPISVSEEKIGLCDLFLESRYPAHRGSARDYYSGFFLNSMKNTAEITFRVGGRLVGVSIVDLSEISLSAVYFYHDPACAKRSLGTYNILFLADLAQREGMRYLYLGYWIEEVAAMRYKARFRPHYLLKAGQWQRVA
ncbi:arginyltransferase [Thiovibrio sp. JS02]